MNNVTLVIHKVTIETLGGWCTVDSEPLNVKAGDQVEFTNDTDRVISITLSNNVILDIASPFAINPRSEVIAGVKSGTGGEVRCTIDCDASTTMAQKTAKPEIIVNRD